MLSLRPSVILHWFLHLFCLNNICGTVVLRLFLLFLLLHLQFLPQSLYLFILLELQPFHLFLSFFNRLLWLFLLDLIFFLQFLYLFVQLLILLANLLNLLRCFTIFSFLISSFRSLNIVQRIPNAISVKFFNGTFFSIFGWLWRNTAHSFWPGFNLIKTNISHWLILINIFLISTSQFFRSASLS